MWSLEIFTYNIVNPRFRVAIYSLVYGRQIALTILWHRSIWNNEILRKQLYRDITSLLCKILISYLENIPRSISVFTNPSTLSALGPYVPLTSRQTAQYRTAPLKQPGSSINYVTLETKFLSLFTKVTYIWKLLYRDNGYIGIEFRW